MSNVSDAVLSLVSEVFAPEPISPEGTFEDLGATSVLLLRLMATIQRQLDIDLDVVDMYSVDDVAGLIHLVEERMAA